MPDHQNIAIVLDPTAARRLVPGMFAYFKPGKMFWLIDALRPHPEILRDLARWQIDGIIMRVHPDLNRELLTLGKPTVICGGNRIKSMVASVSSDGRQVGALAAKHLIDLGLRNFAFFGIEAPFSEQRQHGFVKTLEAGGFTASIHIHQRRGWEHYMELVHVADAGLTKWLKRLPKPFGIFAAHDPLGWHLSQVCRAASIAVPEEAAIISANNDELVCSLAAPPLTSVAVPWPRVGAEVALEMDRLLEAALTGPRKSTQGRLIHVPPVGVVTRQSTDMLAVDNQMLGRALHFIREHAGEPMGVEDILKHVPVSRRKLEIDFQRHLQRSPKEEITRVRIERAKLLLAQTDLPIPVVAERCGYNYPERFTVAFRQQMKVTPMAFRKNFRVSGGS
jgi:LacI family transcriptional regulator